MLQARLDAAAARTADAAAVHQVAQQELSRLEKIPLLARTPSGPAAAAASAALSATERALDHDLEGLEYHKEKLLEQIEEVNEKATRAEAMAVQVACSLCQRPRPIAICNGRLPC